MAFEKFVDPNTTALLVIDMQYDYCSPDGILPKFRKYSTKPILEMIPKLNDFVDQARKHKIKVIWTRMTEDSKLMPENLRLHKGSFEVALDFSIKGTKGYEYYQVHPKKGDKEIEKNQYDAFTNPELDRYLKEIGAKNLIFTGVYAARCVDSTIRSASTKGYNCVIPQDLVGSVTELENEQKAALNIWKSIFGYVMKSDDIVKIWSK